ncbi:NADH-quinone oxidoreductase subunit B [Leptospira sp. WS39.C2]|uniref:NADH-quinone oxidoreductase subunit B n=2 Tax=Leptospira TaxID=171 RepID=A0A7I0HNV0_9LEPT|nr:MULTISPECIES: NADH-quinone oxidoreductase subunit B [Leptospira]MCW7462218.1 NADH-quinone oxidoreductase subunit B [Leptospira limi]TGK47162.1 NADH-quinone oxidoreductase subunit B [Leptospira bouyouniensis]TGL03340.1 NADH-quinone oxidoreductase subunit B [Leptospira bouyouniensis]TGM80267.1 NADH-quinone oxidoreductase subunit B [Leptospira bouyouniensis]
MGLTETLSKPGEMFGDMFQVATLDNVVQWGQSFSLWPYPFATACCGIEYMSTACADYDIARFGAERPSFSPRQADMILVLGTITYKMAPVLRQIYDQLAEPKFVISVGACASSGGMFHTYGVLQGVDRILPVDVYVPGCPPRPEAILDALVKLQKKVQTQGLEARRQEVMKKIQEINERNKPLVVA